MIKVIEPDQSVNILFGETDEGEEVRADMLVCSECGSFAFGISLRDKEVPGDFNGLFCKSCNQVYDPGSISISICEKLIRKQILIRENVRRISRIYQFGFWMAAAFICYLTFFK